MRAVSARTIVERLIERWRDCGLPHYAQFDNDRRFQGAELWPDTLGRVTRMCLSLGWCRCHPASRTRIPESHRESQRFVAGQALGSLAATALSPPCGRSERYVARHRLRSAAHRDGLRRVEHRRHTGVLIPGAPWRPLGLSASDGRDGRREGPRSSLGSERAVGAVTSPSARYVAVHRTTDLC